MKIWSAVCVYDQVCVVGRGVQSPCWARAWKRKLSKILSASWRRKSLYETRQANYLIDTSTLASLDNTDTHEWLRQALNASPCAPRGAASRLTIVVKSPPFSRITALAKSSRPGARLFETNPPSFWFVLVKHYYKVGSADSHDFGFCTTFL